VFGNNIALHKEQTVNANKFVRGNLLMTAMYNNLDYAFKRHGKTIYDGFQDCLLADSSMIEGFVLMRRSDIIFDVYYVKVRQNVFTKKGIYEKMKKEWSKLLKAKDYETLKTISESIIIPPNLISV
jgi:hypothetical protein